MKIDTDRKSIIPNKLFSHPELFDCAPDIRVRVWNLQAEYRCPERGSQQKEESDTPEE